MKKTPKYELPLYEDTDPVDMRNGYNASMRQIEKVLTRFSVRIQDIENILAGKGEK